MNDKIEPQAHTLRFSTVGNFIGNWGLPLVLMGLIFWLSSKPDLGGVGWLYANAEKFVGGTRAGDWLLPLAAWFDPYAAWFGHFAMYGLLCLVLLRAIRRQWPTLPSPALWAWGGTVLYGITDEIHQYFVVGRSAQFHDIVTDGLGAAAALALWLLITRMRTPTPDAVDT